MAHKLIRQTNEEFRLKQGRSPSLATRLERSPERHKELQNKTSIDPSNGGKQSFKRTFWGFSVLLKHTDATILPPELQLPCSGP